MISSKTTFHPPAVVMVIVVPPLVQLVLMISGAVPVVPDRLAYPEYVPASQRYQSAEEAVAMILAARDNTVDKSRLPRWSELAPAYASLLREVAY